MIIDFRNRDLEFKILMNDKPAARPEWSSFFLWLEKPGKK